MALLYQKHVGKSWNSMFILLADLKTTSHTKLMVSKFLTEKNAPSLSQKGGAHVQFRKNNHSKQKKMVIGQQIHSNMNDRDTT